jgi:hypothetical protein
VRDLRKYARETDFRSLVGFIFLLLIIGDGLIFVFYGVAGAISGLLCIVAGMAPLLLIWLFLLLMEFVARNANGE